MKLERKDLIKKLAEAYADEMREIRRIKENKHFTQEERNEHLLSSVDHIHAILEVAEKKGVQDEVLEHYHNTKAIMDEKKRKGVARGDGKGYDV